MKLATAEEVAEYRRAIAIGGAKGAGVGAGISAGVFYALRGKPFYRALSPTVKTFIGLVPVLALGITVTERASLQFEMNQYGYGDALKDKLEKEKRLEQLPFKERAMHYAQTNKYKIIVGAWAASLGGSFWYINRDKLLTKSQKIVQARMYAQALTVLILLGTISLSIQGGNTLTEEEIERRDNWKKVVEEEEVREKAAGLPLHLEKRHQ